MKKKLFALGLLTVATSSFAAPVSTPNNLNDTVVIGSNSGSDCSCCRRIDLTNAKSDYNLQPGEEAVIKFYNNGESTIQIPLHIATAPDAVYEIKIFDVEPIPNWDKGHTSLCPNNQSYPSQFKSIAMWADESRAAARFAYSVDCFYIDKFPVGMASATVNTGNRVMMWDSAFDTDSTNNMRTVRFVGTTKWLDKETPWTSLGTIWTTLKSGFILVKRIY
jgi:hypothetical protein